MNKIIKSENLRYFIFDTGVTGKDIDFVQYDWNKKLEDTPYHWNELLGYYLFLYIFWKHG